MGTLVEINDTLQLTTEQGFPADRIVVIPNGVEVSDHGPISPEEKNAIFKEWDIPADSRVVGYAGRLAPQKRGADLFVNARTDVYLRGLIPAERAESEAIARGRKYLEAGADGLFVPGVTNPATIRAIVAAVPLPVNVLVAPGMPIVAELQSLGVRRVSVGSALTQGAYALTKRAATQVLKEGRWDVLLDRTLTHRDLNALFAK